LDTLLHAEQMKQAEAFVKWAGAINTVREITEGAAAKGDIQEQFVSHLQAEMEDCVIAFKDSFKKTLELLSDQITETHALAQRVNLKWKAISANRM